MFLRFIMALTALVIKLVWIFIKFLLGIETKVVQRNQSDINQYLIRLSSEDPLFYLKKQKLKKSGYRWHCHQKAWVLPQIKPRKNQVIDVVALKRLGYLFDPKSESWLFPYQ